MTNPSSVSAYTDHLTNPAQYDSCVQCTSTDYAIQPFDQNFTAVAVTQSAYGYVSSNPLNGTDPSGQVPCGPTSHMYWLGACDSETEAISKQLPFSATQFIFLSLLPLFPAGIFAGAEEGACAAEAAETETSAAARALARLPKAARESEKPPGFNPETWQWREGSRTNVPRSWWDPEGGEWRFHPADKNHDPHFDYNPWQQWNTPWQHPYPGN